MGLRQALWKVQGAVGGGAADQGPVRGAEAPRVVPEVREGFLRRHHEAEADREAGALERFRIVPEEDLQARKVRACTSPFAEVCVCVVSQVREPFLMLLLLDVSLASTPQSCQHALGKRSNA